MLFNLFLIFGAVFAPSLGSPLPSRRASSFDQRIPFSGFNSFSSSLQPPSGIRLPRAGGNPFPLLQSQPSTQEDTRFSTNFKVIETPPEANSFSQDVPSETQNFGAQKESIQKEQRSNFEGFLDPNTDILTQIRNGVTFDQLRLPESLNVDFGFDPEEEGHTDPFEEEVDVPEEEAPIQNIRPQIPSKLTFTHINPVSQIIRNNPNFQLQQGLLMNKQQFNFGSAVDLQKVEQEQAQQKNPVSQNPRFQSAFHQQPRNRPPPSIHSRVDLRTGNSLAEKIERHVRNPKPVESPEDPSTLQRILRSSSSGTKNLISVPVRKPNVETNEVPVDIISNITENEASFQTQDIIPDQPSIPSFALKPVPTQETLKNTENQRQKFQIPTFVEEDKPSPVINEPQVIGNFELFQGIKSEDLTEVSQFGEPEQDQESQGELGYLKNYKIAVNSLADAARNVNFQREHDMLLDPELGEPNQLLQEISVVDQAPETPKSIIRTEQIPEQIRSQIHTHERNQHFQFNQQPVVKSQVQPLQHQTFEEFLGPLVQPLTKPVVKQAFHESVRPSVTSARQPFVNQQIQQYPQHPIQPQTSQQHVQQQIQQNPHKQPQQQIKQKPQQYVRPPIPKLPHQEPRFVGVSRPHQIKTHRRQQGQQPFKKPIRPSLHDSSQRRVPYSVHQAIQKSKLEQFFSQGTPTKQPGYELPTNTGIRVATLVSKDIKSDDDSASSTFQGPPGPHFQQTPQRQGASSFQFRRFK